MDFRPLLQNRWLLILAVIGIACLLLGTFFKPQAISTLAGAVSNAASPSTAGNGQEMGVSDGSTQDAQNALDSQLTTILKQIDGVNDVSVMVTFDSTDAVKVATNTRTTQQTQGANTNTASTSSTTDTQVYEQRKSDGSSAPYVLESSSPKVRGVLVVVSANDFVLAKSEIIDAIKNVLDVPAYNISVEPKKE